tara:strand:- start:2525 stop:2764 length:240 start_codon:yes stop_codon:yes gene_type:complete
MKIAGLATPTNNNAFLSAQQGFVLQEEVALSIVNRMQTVWVACKDFSIVSLSLEGQEIIVEFPKHVAHPAQQMRIANHV